MRILKTLLRDAGGATAVEYGLLACLISLGLLSGLTAFSSELNNVFFTVDTAIVNAGK